VITVRLIQFFKDSNMALMRTCRKNSEGIKCRILRYMVLYYMFKKCKI